MRSTIQLPQDVYSSRVMTPKGVFMQDPCGLYHYEYLHPGLVAEAAEDALENKPRVACWFWFDSTPAPMQPEDTVKTLVVRWLEWRKTYAVDLVNKMIEYTDPGIPF